MKSKNYAKLALFAMTITSAFIASQGTPAKASGDITGYVYLGYTKKPAAGIQVHGLKTDYTTTVPDVTTDSHGRYTIHNLPNGTYILLTEDKKGLLKDWFPVAKKVTVADGLNAKDTNLVVIRGAVIRGKVTNVSTGRPIAQAAITAFQAQGLRRCIAVTGASGSYVLYVPPGTSDLQIMVPMADNYTKKLTVDLPPGGTQVIDFPVGDNTIRREFTGLVVGPNGQPIRNAEVIGREVNAGPFVVQTTYLGGFDMTLRPGGTILARSGNLGTGAVTYEGEKKLVIHLKPGKLCAIKGQVTNDDGTPVTDATIMLSLKGSINDIGFAAGRTDSKGYYSLPPTYQNETYYVQVDSPTHDQLKSPNFFIHPAQTIHTMPLTLSFADSFAGGIVLDPQGDPYYGAVLSRDGNDYGLTFKTDESGRFMMKHVPRKTVHIFVQTGIGNFTQVDLKCGISDNVVRLPEKAMPK